VEVQTGGFTPGLAARVQLAGGDRVFVKGIAADHPLAGRYADEARVMRALPGSVPAPRLRWEEELAGWVVLAFDDAGGRHADLAPGSADVAPVVETVAGLAAVLTPCPVPGVPDAGTELAGMVHGWRELAAAPEPPADPWTARNLHRLADIETSWLAAADGATLLHGDINRSNLLVGPGRRRVVLVDWGQPVRGAAWIDVADLVPHLILAGHTPAAAEDAVSGALAAALEAAGASGEVVTGYAAAFAAPASPPGAGRARGRRVGRAPHALGVARVHERAGPRGSAWCGSRGGTVGGTVRGIKQGASA
jgi:aminoglycoside phosphotransferase (APT) family kinase protein